MTPKYSPAHPGNADVLFYPGCLVHNPGDYMIIGKVCQPFKQRICGFLTLAGLIAYVVVMGSSCSYGPITPEESFETPATYFSTSQSFTINIAYEPQAQPYVGMLNNLPAWEIVRQNMDSLVACHSEIKAITITSELSQMTQIPVQNRSTWTLQQIYSLSNDWRLHSTKTESQFWIVFLNGNYLQNDTLQPLVLGVTLVGKPVIAIFKDVILATTPTTNAMIYIEQSTMVHEMGHVLGVVDIGVPLTVSHEDPSHPGHCSNTDCIMFYLNEGTSGLWALTKQYQNTGKLFLFGPECQNDVCAFSP